MSLSKPSTTDKGKEKTALSNSYGTFQSETKKEEESNPGKDDKKIYTENDFDVLKQKHKDELESLRIECEFRLQEVACLSTPNQDFTTASVRFLSAATSPIPQEAMSPTTPGSRKSSARPRTTEDRTSLMKTTNVKTSQVLPKWGKNLPENFFDRLEHFSKASAKHYQDLSEKTKKAVQESYELQMATQNRLSAQEDELNLNDVCLPALFMPSRMGTVYSPKARLYFHPAGVSRRRFTQPPSVFKLPASERNSSASVINLYDISKNFANNGPPWLSHSTRPRSARTMGRKSDEHSKIPCHNALDNVIKMKFE